MRRFACAALLGLFAAPIWGDIVNIPTSGLPALIYNGEYVGPAKGTDNGNPLDLWCDDFMHVTTVPTTYSADVSTIPTLTHARFNPDAENDALTDYKQIAWLVGQYYLMSSTDRANNTKVGDLQFAIWLIFDPNESSLKTTGALNWLTTVNGVDLSAYDYSNVKIFTPQSTTECGTNPCAPSNQEFINGGPLPPVPEPTSILLLGTGALATLLVLRRRRKGADSRA